MRRGLIGAALAAALAASAARADVNPSDFDRRIRPQDDFYGYANGRWLLQHAIPAAFGSFGTFNVVNERTEEELHTLLENAAQAESPTGERKLVGDFYASGMDAAAIEAAGLAPIQPELDRIAAVRRIADLAPEIARLHVLGFDVAFSFGAEQDPGDSAREIAAVAQGGLGLPDRDYYLRTDARSVRLRELYAAHAARLLALAGRSIPAARQEADAALAIESALARGSKSSVEQREAVENYHLMPLAEAEAMAPRFDWRAYFSALDLPPPAQIDVGQPEFLRTFDGLLASVPVAQWRAYLRWRVLSDLAPCLPSAFVREDFEFNGRTMTGTQEIRERWRRVMSAIDDTVGEALGRLYIAEYFPEASRSRATRMVGLIRDVLREDLQTLSWMDPPTRAAAIRKLDAMTFKVGYPDRWRDYGRLRIDRGPFVLNVLRAREFESRRDLAKIGRPVDREEWQMTPPTVNAYYDSSLNEIVLPAGILQPPFFSPRADEPLNYGAIGSIIGHEMTHGFDDQGRKFDGRGNLRDWWTPASARRFAELASGIVRQFDAYVAIDGEHVNGALTEGENIADLGGVKLAFRAMERALGNRPRVKIGGFTPEQRFFYAYATDWRENVRPEQLRLEINTDPHAPGRFRTNGPLSNLPEFARAFGIPEGAPMARPAAERVVIW